MFNLLEIARIKCYARALRVTKIEQKGERIVIHFNDSEFLTSDMVQILIDNYKNKIFFSSNNVPYITLKLQSINESDILKEVLKILKIIKS